MPDSQEQYAEATAASGGHPQLCVIDESRAVRSFVATSLKKLEVNLREFASGSEGFDYLAEESPPVPTLVIMETHYRNLEALTLIKTLRSVPATAYIPILLFSYTNDAALITNFLQAGADEFIHKPCKAEELVARVQLLLWNLETLASKRSRPALPAVIVDTDLKEISPLRSALSRKGHPVLCTANPVTARRHCSTRRGLALVELALPGVDGPQLVRELARDTGAKVITMSASAAPEKIAAAAKAGAKTHLRKPILKELLSSTLEEVLQSSPVLSQIEIEPQYLRRLLSGTRPFPPLMEGEISLSFTQAAELFAQNPGLAEAKIVLSGKTIFIKGKDAPVTENTGSTVSTRIPHPFVRDGYPISEEALASIIASHRQDPQSIISEAGEVVSSLPILQTYALGKFLHHAAPVRKEDLIEIIRGRPNLFGALKKVGPDSLAEAAGILTGSFDYLDNFFIFLKLRAENREELLRHLVCVSMLSVLAGIARLQESGELDPEQRQAVLTVLGLGGFLHDLGYVYRPLPSRDHPRFTLVLNKHAEAGYQRLAECKTFRAVKCIIRDHHAEPGHWQSKYDRATHLVQAANDLDNLLRPLGILSLGNTVEPSPEPYSFAEACLLLAERARHRKGRIEDVKTLLSALGVTLS